MSSRILRQIITSPLAPPAIGPYSQGVLVKNTLYVSGQIGMNTKHELEADLPSQTKLALENIGHVLKAARGDYKDVVKTTVLLKDMKDFQSVNQIYAEYFKDNFPARACYEVANLPKGALVEIEAIAVIDD